MISCYLLSALTFLMLLLAFFQYTCQFLIFKANDVAFMILTSIVYLFTETLVIFFFVGTGVSIREYTQEHHLPHQFHQKSIAIKRMVYPPLLFNMLLMIILFVLIGAVDTGKIPSWSYQLYFLVCLGHFCYAKFIQHQAFRENTFNVLAMAGVQGTT